MAQRVYNLLESLLWDEVEAVLPRYTDMCRCDQCRLDVYTLALNLLPPVYVTGKRYNNDLKRTAATKYLDQMHQAISKAALKVKEKPRPECRKRHGFWVSPDAPAQATVILPTEAPAVEAAQSVPLAPWEVPVETPPAPVAPVRRVQYSQIKSTRRRY